jgi:hypothetical protein
MIEYTTVILSFVGGFSFAFVIFVLIGILTGKKIADENFTNSKRHSDKSGGNLS